MVRVDPDWAAEKRSRARRGRMPLIALGAVLCMGATFAGGQEMARWRLHRINMLEDAFAVSDEAPRSVRRKSMVAMQREARRSIERLRALALDSDQAIASDAHEALVTIEQSLR